MYRVLFFWLAMTASAAASIVDSATFINEFHYDNIGSDSNQFVEVAVPVARVDLSALTLTLYNGGLGTTYGGPFSLRTFSRGDTVGGKSLYILDVSLQNGAPDGLALADGTDVLQFLSYEGDFTATNGVAAGLTSTDIGTSEPSNTPSGYALQLAGSGDSLFDFTWQAPAVHTRGALNHNQSFTGGGSGPVPEVGALGLWFGLFLTAAVIWGLLRRQHPCPPSLAHSYSYS